MRRLLLCLAMALLLLPQFSSAQSRQIKGTVSDDKGSPLPFVSVIEKGTQNGTTTNENGAFTISVTKSKPVLVFSYTGMQSHELTVGNSNSYSVSLSTVGAMSEVVVTAMGISKEKKALGYASQQVGTTELNRNHQANLVNALQGKVAGATISSVGGGPGQGATIRIRGINSIDVTQSNDPLFVIDGIILDNSTSTLGSGSGYNVRTVGNRASDINPDDIETINILKGGAATALYGLRGANGVVVITTKKGKGDGVRVNVSSTYGFENINKTPEIQRTYTAGILGVYTPIGLGPAWGPTIAEAKAGTGPGNVAADPTHPDEIYDNYKQAYRTGKQMRNSINMTGGSETVKFYSSLSYFDQEGMLPFTDYKNISGRLNTDVKISNKLKASVNMSYTNSGGYRYDADRFGESLAYFSGRWNVQDYLNPDGTQLWRGTNNPIYGAATNRLKDRVNRFVGGLSFGYTPFSWLNFSYRVGGDIYTDNRFRTAPGLRGITGERSYDNAEGYVGEYNTNYRALNSTFMATLTSKLGKNFNSSLRLGHELLDREITSRGVLGSKLNVFDWFNLRNAAVLESSDNSSQYRLMGLFGEATIDYKNFLFLSLTGRNDITSSLRKPNNSFFYPSASLSYLFSEQLKLPEFISSGKARISYAKIGKDALPYSTSTGYSAYSSLPAGTTGFTRGANLGDPNLRPEFTNTIEGGLEMSFLKNRLGFDATYYHSISEDQIINVNVSSAIGYVRAAVNSGSMRNKGIELVLRGTPIKTSNFTWDANLNFSANRNKVLSIREGLTEIPYGGSSGGYVNSPVTMKLIPGEAYGNIYGTHWLRYYGGKEEDKVRTDKSLPMVIGANGFPVLAPVSSQKLLGNSQPDWVGGFSNTVTYKNFTLSALVDARWGFEKFNRLDNFFAAFGIADYTADRREFKVFEGVLADGTPNTKKVWLGQGVGPDGVNYGEGYYRNYYRAISEPFVEDASWIRLRSASLAYNLPASWLPKNFIRNASVSVTGNNLWLYTKYYGLDPESVSADSGSNVDGSAGFTYPSARTFLFTINVGF
ncbi:SusC/RagA family TonB-linked outer membrane protein [Flavisolibacter tropicus]|uniref:TonB-dependent receptor n=1 Tax=Flavisolibacter tropicus TaxID=1492898 RepID=A0A172TZ88_9BACT|nr:SusC/RagA family TonB-linked outer membrane protein [Flavisolibacter tropicus]ANE52103.1 TonB-dependent receptor [Flavisolibacter tropicus]